MKILEIIENHVYFNIDQNKQIDIDNLSGDNIFDILEKIANNKDYYDFSYEKNDINNDVYRPLVENLMKLFIDFKDNIDNLKESIDNTF